MFHVANLGAGGVAPGSREDLIKALVRQAERYHFASKQDANLVVAARHNAYASGIIGVVIEQTDETQIMDLMGISLRALKDDIYAVQDVLERKAFDLLGPLS